MKYRWGRTGVLSVVVIPPFGLFAFQANGVHVTNEAIWTTAIGALSFFFVWLGSTTLSNKVLLTEVVTLLRGENGVFPQLEAHGKKIEGMEELVTRGQDQTVARVLEISANQDGRIERVEGRIDALMERGLA